MKENARHNVDDSIDGQTNIYDLFVQYQGIQIAFLPFPTLYFEVVQRCLCRVVEQINPTGQTVYTQLVVRCRDLGCEIRAYECPYILAGLEDSKGLGNGQRQAQIDLGICGVEGDVVLKHDGIADEVVEIFASELA